MESKDEVSDSDSGIILQSGELVDLGNSPALVPDSRVSP